MHILVLLLHRATIELYLYSIFNCFEKSKVANWCLEWFKLIFGELISLFFPLNNVDRIAEVITGMKG